MQIKKRIGEDLRNCEREKEEVKGGKLIVDCRFTTWKLSRNLDRKKFNNCMLENLQLELRVYSHV